MLPSSAYAGINGRKVRVKFTSVADCLIQSWDVTITGYNQDGNYAVWKKSAAPNTFCYIEADKWFWKGNITVTAKSRQSQYDRNYTKSVFVNNVGGWYTVKLP